MGSQEDAGSATRAETEPARRAAILTEPAAFLGSHETHTWGWKCGEGTRSIHRV